MTRAQAAALTILTASAGYVGGWATLSPGSFYDSFPGLNRTWISIDGPFNEHLVRDVGAFYLALAAAGVLALWWRERHVTIVTVAAWTVFSTPHLAYHLLHAHELETMDAVGQTFSLAVTLLLAVFVLVAAARTRETSA